MLFSEVVASPFAWIFLIVEHDPMLYEDSKQMVEYVG
jgi:hypothetical protein